MNENNSEPWIFTRVAELIFVLFFSRFVLAKVSHLYGQVIFLAMLREHNHRYCSSSTSSLKNSCLKMQLQTT